MLLQLSTPSNSYKKEKVWIRLFLCNAMIMMTLKKKITSGRTTFPTSLHGRTAYGASLASTEVYLAKYYSLKAISNL